MGGRGERQGLSRVAFYCKHYLAGPVAFSQGGGWIVLSSKYILLEWQGYSTFLRATDLTCSKENIYHSFWILVLSPPTTCSATSPRGKYQTSKYFWKSAEIISYPFPWVQPLEQAEGQTCHSWIDPPKHFCKSWHTTEALPALTDKQRKLNGPCQS